MQVFGIVGQDASVATDHVVEALPGRVAVIWNRREDREVDGGTQRARPATEYDLGAEWQAFGERLSLEDTLDRLAPDHEYAVAVGFREASLPQVVVGAADVTEPLVRVDDPSALAVDDLLKHVDALEPHETLESLVASVERSADADRAGAVATFTGRVRERDGPDDDRTEFLEFETYEAVADERLRAIETELSTRDGVFEVALHHRTGVVPAGEDVVHVVVLAGHREEAFRTVEDGIDRLKAEVPIFKKEVTESETFWVHERE